MYKELDKYTVMRMVFLVVEDDVMRTLKGRRKKN